MIQRLQKLSQEHSFFLFGARGTGKTTLLKQLFPQKGSLWIDLLSFEEEDRFSRNPDLLSQILSESTYKRVIVDEVQKVPKILDIVHLESEKNKKTQFILTGSNSRKLKKGKANLLAGRLFTFTLHPLTHLEDSKDFNLHSRLRWGAMPALRLYKKDQDRRRYLESYVQTYLKEEILAEQLVRNIRPFRDFLELSAQTSGQIVNYSKIARDIGVDWTTAQKYFDILIDTYLGFYLKSFNRSFRKQFHQASKFYLFDSGIQRILSYKAHTIPKSGYEYGRAFEQFILLELFRLNSCYEAGFRFSYLRDKDGQEVDLIIQKPGGAEVLVEIKSGVRALEKHAKSLQKFMETWDRPCTGQLWSNDPKNRRVGGISFLHWKTALKRLFQ